MSDLININSGVVQGKTKILLILGKPRSLEAHSQEPGTKIDPILYYTMAALRWEGGAPTDPCGVPTKLQVKSSNELEPAAAIPGSAWWSQGSQRTQSLHFSA